MKRFSDAPESAKRVQFSLDLWNGNQPQTHEFAAYPALDALALGEINKLAANDKTALESLTRMKNYIRTMLDDGDGTPLDWEPTPLPREMAVPDGELTGWPEETADESAAVTISGALDDDEAEVQFLAPDGTVHPIRDARKYQELHAGSSRRRWVQLVDGDNDLTLSAKTLTKLWHWLVSEVADRPTVR